MYETLEIIQANEATAIREIDSLRGKQRSLGSYSSSDAIMGVWRHMRCQMPYRLRVVRMGSVPDIA